ncbi:hypothetical protein SBA3_1180002 [Candidatus Sulfopaludibacter sp. SbA3]|nr:hypothetical protein SBA3_1180002 [Candidatus Sulfopaludibacter sp. SbA3]
MIDPRRTKRCRLYGVALVVGVLAFDACSIHIIAPTDLTRTAIIQVFYLSTQLWESRQTQWPWHCCRHINELLLKGEKTALSGRGLTVGISMHVCAGTRAGRGA